MKLCNSTKVSCGRDRNIDRAYMQGCETASLCVNHRVQKIPYTLFSPHIDAGDRRDATQVDKWKIMSVVCGAAAVARTAFSPARLGSSSGHSGTIYSCKGPRERDTQCHHAIHRLLSLTCNNLVKFTFPTVIDRGGNIKSRCDEQMSSLYTGTSRKPYPCSVKMM